MSERRHEIKRKILELQNNHQEGLSISACARELKISVSYAYACYSDPDGELDRKRKESYAGKCEICGGKTTGSAGPGLAPIRCFKHNRGSHPRKWTRELIIEAIQEWNLLHGSIPSATDWGAPDRYSWCPHFNTVYEIFGKGGWNKAIEEAGFVSRPPEPPDYAKAVPGVGPWDFMTEEQRRNSQNLSRERMLKELKDPESKMSKGQKIGQEINKKHIKRATAKKIQRQRKN